MISVMLLLGAVSGSPQPISPGPTPTVWAEYTNDNFLAFGPDDGYTAGLHGGVAVDRWRLGIGLDIFTENPTSRADEITVTASYAFGLGDVSWSAGVGGRWAGDFGGESIQTWWHQTNGDEPVIAPYDEHGWRPVAVVDAAWKRQIGDQWRLFATGSALGSYDFAQAEVTACIAFGDREDGCVWIGPRFAGYVGKHLTRSEEFAFDDFGGPGLAFGVRAEYFQMHWVWTGPGIYGSVGVDF